MSTRFSRGMSTPAMRAIPAPLSLPLLVLRLGADHEDRALAPDDLALVAALLDACPDFHFGTFLVTFAFPRTFLTSLPVLRSALVADPTRDATTLQVVRTQLDQDLVPGNDAYEVHSHLPADVREDRMTVLELDLEHGVGEGLRDGALHFDHVLVRRLATRQNSPRHSMTRGHRTREPKLYPNRPTLSTFPPASCGRHPGLPLGKGEDDRALRRAPDGVLEVRREAAVAGDDGP